MRCRTCDYPLWRTTSRTCPECGSEFHAQEYRFEPGAVVYRCPHCREGYFGTGRDGHLEPPAFDCVTCGQAITMDQMSIEPAYGVDEALTGPPPNPWASRQKIGVMRAWFQSVMAILGAPTEFIRGLPANSPVGDSVLFAGITATFGALLGLVLVGIALLFQAFFTGRFAGAGQYVLVQLVLALFNIVFAIVSSMIAGFVAHVVLKMLRGTSGGLGRSMPAILYGYGATGIINLLVCCPCTWLISPVWWCVSIARMLQEVHKAQASKTITAAIVAAVAWISILGMGTWASAVLTGKSSGFGPRIQVGTPAVDGDSFSSNGVPYATPLAAVADGAMPMTELLDLIAPDDEPVVIGGLSAEALDEASDATIARLSERLAAILPADQAPFRLGRAVFVYRNATSSSSAWQALVLPTDPNAPEARWTIVRRRSIVTVAKDEFLEHVTAENKRRTDAKRAPLGDLSLLPDLLLRKELSAPEQPAPVVPSEPAPVAPSEPAPPAEPAAPASGPAGIPGGS